MSQFDLIHNSHYDHLRGLYPEMSKSRLKWLMLHLGELRDNFVREDRTISWGSDKERINCLSLAEKHERTQTVTLKNHPITTEQFWGRFKETPQAQEIFPANITVDLVSRHWEHERTRRSKSREHAASGSAARASSSSTPAPCPALPLPSSASNWAQAQRHNLTARKLVDIAEITANHPF
ncbi:hypothetical protein B0T10DRAFT_45998 [Thelonectria olida]|uniref:Uncharacterized protein n=1 Tax=Thelonectria olida TaxID=1576542 RepID=A0A9P8VP48_9HYPO|nr:hypothetical protein B0T10DRAFT_45998 [Thelonectria olida]